MKAYHRPNTRFPKRGRAGKRRRREEEKDRQQTPKKKQTLQTQKQPRTFISSYELNLFLPALARLQVLLGILDVEFRALNDVLVRLLDVVLEYFNGYFVACYHPGGGGVRTLSARIGKERGMARRGMSRSEEVKVKVKKGEKNPLLKEHPHPIPSQLLTILNQKALMNTLNRVFRLSLLLFDFPRGFGFGGLHLRRESLDEERVDRALDVDVWMGLDELEGFLED